MTRTTEEAIDRAIERYNQKHGVERSLEVGVVWLPLRGWVT